jgi:hypothetical protein
MLLSGGAGQVLATLGNWKGKGSDRFWNAASKHCLKALPFLFFTILRYATLAQFMRFPLSSSNKPLAKCQGMVVSTSPSHWCTRVYRSRMYDMYSADPWCTNRYHPCIVGAPNSAMQSALLVVAPPFASPSTQSILFKCNMTWYHAASPSPSLWQYHKLF